MKEIIRFNAKHLSKLLTRMIIVGLTITLALVYVVDIELSYVYMLSSLIIFICVLYVFYLNKNDPEFIEICDNELRVSYINKTFFKRDSIVLQKNEINVEKNDDFVNVLQEEEVILVIRKNSLSSSDYNKLCEFIG